MEAYQKVAEQQLNKSGGVIGTITNAITKDGMLAAAFRQGATELAIALGRSRKPSIPRNRLTY